MKKHSVFLSAAMSFAMIFSAVPVNAQEAEIQAEGTETAIDYLYFAKSSYTAVAGKTSNVYLNPMSFPMASESLSVQVEDTSIAEIGQWNSLVPKKAGTTKAYCEYGGKRAEAEIIVLEGDYADSIMIEGGASNYLLPGEKLQLSYTLSSNSDPSKTEFKDEKVTWDVVDFSGSGAVTVDENGLVTAVRNGYVTVRAHIASGIYSNHEIIVAPAIKSMKFTGNISAPYREWGSLDLDQYLTCSPEGSDQRDIVWTSSNENVLTANNGGSWLSMKGPGVTTVTAASADDASIYAQVTVELYEPVTPTAIRRTSPENVTLYMNAEYGGVHFNVAYSPEKADDSTTWTSSDSDLMSAYSAGGTAVNYRYYGTGNVQLTAASESVPSLTTTFNVTITDDPLPSDFYTTEVYAAPWNQDKGALEAMEPVSSVLTLNTGDIVWVTIADESDIAVPDPGSRIRLFDGSSIVTSGELSGMMPQISGNHVTSRPAVALYAKAAGEETYNLGNRELTIRVNDAEPQDNVIKEARILSDLYIEPAGAGSAFIWPSDMRTPEGTHYMTPDEYNDTQDGQGSGDSFGALYEGTPGRRGMRITWDNFTFEANQSYVYICSLYAEEGYTFADDTEVWLNDHKAALVTNNGSKVTVWFQFGPYEEETVKEVTRIWFSDTSYTLQVGQSFVLIPHIEPYDAAAKITITSSDSSVVSNEDNLLHARKAGTAVITAAAENGVKATCTIRVVFTDVPAEGEYYSAPVYWAVERGITNGYFDDDNLAREFRPKNKCTREAVVTFLWRLAGRPEPKTRVSPFSDVRDSSKYYYKAVLWAAENKITAGYSDGTFRPNATCLREHVVTFLYRYAGQPNPGVSRNPFNDVSSSDYYYRAVLWANAKGIAKGYSSGPNAGGFGPKLDCLREHVVTFLYRYAK